MKRVKKVNKYKNYLNRDKNYLNKDKVTHRDSKKPITPVRKNSTWELEHRHLNNSLKFTHIKCLTSNVEDS